METARDEKCLGGLERQDAAKDRKRERERERGRRERKWGGGAGTLAGAMQPSSDQPVGPGAPRNPKPLAPPPAALGPPPPPKYSRRGPPPPRPAPRRGGRRADRRPATRSTPGRHLARRVSQGAGPAAQPPAQAARCPGDRCGIGGSPRSRVISGVPAQASGDRLTGRCFRPHVAPPWLCNARLRAERSLDQRRLAPLHGSAVALT